MIDNLERVSFLLVTIGLAWGLGAVLDGLIRDHWTVRYRVVDGKIRNGLLLGIGSLWVFRPMGPISFTVVCAVLAVLIATIVADLRGWAWRELFRREKVGA